MPDSLDANQILDAIQRCAAPIWTSVSLDAPPATVDHNGTCGFLDTGNKRILITAWHVIEKFNEIKVSNSDAVLAVNLGAGCTVALSHPEIIDWDKGFDIATLSFPDLNRQTAPHDKQYFPIQTWPIPRVTTGNAVALVGFPGERRKTHRYWGSFESVGAGFIVASSSDRTIVLADQSGTMRLENSSGQDDGIVRLGGFSGSPVFLVHPNGPQVVGVLRAGSDEMGRGAGNTIFLTPTYFLREDGTFDRGLMPG